MIKICVSEEYVVAAKELIANCRDRFQLWSQDPLCYICSVFSPANPQRGQEPEPSLLPVLLP